MFKEHKKLQDLDSSKFPPELKKYLDKEQQMLARKDKFILDENKNPIPANLIEWAEFFEDFNNRMVKQEMVDGKWISTIFLGIDHNWSDAEGAELHIFETMVFDKKGRGGSEIYCDRYPTWDTALKGHEKAVQWVKDGCKEER
jgi:hypothetical protein